MKPYDIEIQRLKSMKHDKGLIEVSVDALVIARKLQDEGAATTCLHIPVEHARTLLLLLKQQFAELDKLQPRSRRSGRA
jgi:BarA-like signal transduction histidine kinase